MNFWLRILTSREALLFYLLIFMLMWLPKALPFLIAACIFALVVKAGGGGDEL